ncbi:MAG: PhzF family phenazine biosynthesis protein [Planctomycetes bacterium]|nr:PhzF family phenazine biosynthesis protein [Planctomycetota bacterium]
MRTYLRLDVFTDRPFGGNPLAVFPEAAGLSTAAMQTIAREMNLSETVFCLPPAAPGADVRLRIFTVDREVPLAGHPTVGTVFALAETGRLAVADSGGVVRCELGVGVLPVAVEREPDGARRVTMTQRSPRFGASIDDRGLIAAALGLDEAGLARGGARARVVDTGIPWLLLPLVDSSAVRALRPRPEACRELATRAGTDLIHAFAWREGAAGEPLQVHTRHVWFGTVTPGEDPATGSAAGCLGAHLAEPRFAKGAAECRVVVAQGAEVGRPSRIDVHVAAGPEPSVRVGGRAVLVGGGELVEPV